MESPKDTLAPLLDAIEQASKKHRRTGIFLAVLGILGAIGVYCIGLNTVAVDEKILNLYLAKGKDIQALVLYDLLTKVISGSFLIAVFYWIFRICMASFDQSVRYRKRLHSALFLEKYLDVKYSNDKDNIALIRQKMEFYEVWVKSTDSAFGINRKDQQKIFGAQMEHIKEVLTIARDMHAASEQVPRPVNEAPKTAS